MKAVMDDYDIRSAASILASVKEQEARFERLTRALEEERRNVSLQLERANQPADRMSICNIGNGQPLATAWQQLVLQVTACSFHCHWSPPLAQCPIPESWCVVRVVSISLLHALSFDSPELVYSLCASSSHLGAQPSFRALPWELLFS